LLPVHHHPSSWGDRVGHGVSPQALGRMGVTVLGTQPVVPRSNPLT
jgi:hypothetical protein